MRRLRFLCLLTALALCLAAACPAAAGEALSGYTLRESSGEVKVFAIASVKANIVGYIIPGGQQEVDVLSVSGDWCYVRFTSVYGESYGYISLACFEVAAAPTPTPVPEQSYDAGMLAFVCNAQPGYRLNLRAHPSASAESYGKYYTGVEVMLTGAVSNGYAQVILEGVLGWMDTRYLQLSGAVLLETPVVTVDHPDGGINLRRGAGTDQTVIGWYPHGTEVTILGVTEDGWYHVEIEGRTGYVSGTLLSEVFPFQYGTDSDHPGVSSSLTSNENLLYINARSASSRLNLRAAPSTTSSSLGQFYTGTAVEVLSYTRTGWAYVRIGQLEGYMDADYLTATQPQQYGQTRTVRNPYATGLNLRDMPTTDGTILAFCANYTTVTVLGDLTDNWCYVQVGDTLGYMLGTRLE